MFAFCTCALNSSSILVRGFPTIENGYLKSKKIREATFQANYCLFETLYVFSAWVHKILDSCIPQILLIDDNYLLKNSKLVEY